MMYFKAQRKVAIQDGERWLTGRDTMRGGDFGGGGGTGGGLGVFTFVPISRVLLPP